MKTLLLCSVLALPAGAGAAPGDFANDKPPRPPQLSVEVGGSLSPLEHPSVQFSLARGQTLPVHGRQGAGRLSGGLNFNLVRGSEREDLWWTNGVDWYLTGSRIQVLSLRPGLEKRFSLAPKLSLGVSAFGTASEVAVPTGRFTTIGQPVPGGYDPTSPSSGEVRARDWIFGAGASASLQYKLSSLLYARFQAGYTQYFETARDFAVAEGVSALDSPFTVDLSGPWAGAFIGIAL